MMEKQKMIDGTFGPTRAHDDDCVICGNGILILHRNAFYDCEGIAHCNDEDRDAADLTIVEDILDAMVEGQREYYTENDDYASGYDHIVFELCHEWPDIVKQWMCDNYADYVGYGKFDDYIDAIVFGICENLEGSFDCDLEYVSSDYCSYTGPGCCLFSFSIDEVEEQVDLSCCDEFAALHDDGRLRGLLESVNCDAYIGSLEHSLRDKYPCFEYYHSPGGQWQYVVSEERMKQALTTAIIGFCRTGR